MISHTGKHLNYHTQNLIYLLARNLCSTQYADETALQLNMGINCHRTNKCRCEHIVYWSNGSCESLNFSLQILENFPGTDCDHFCDLDDFRTQI